MSDEDRDAEVAQKVVAIMQTIAEDTENRRKKAWRKMLGLDEGRGRVSEAQERTDAED